MVTCQLCGKEFKTITYYHLKTVHNYNTTQYKKEFGTDSLAETPIKAKKAVIEPKPKPKVKDVKEPVVEELTEAKPKVKDAEEPVVEELTEVNPKKLVIKEKVANYASVLWEQGTYAKPVLELLSCDPASYIGAQVKLKDFLARFQDVDKCNRCGSIALSIPVYYVDDDSTNFLPSNLEPLCTDCRMSFMSDKLRQPYVTVSKEFKFVAAHRLPNHKGKCSNWHGHSFVCEVSIRKRLDPDSGMVIDFGYIKDILEEHVISKLDHSILNDYIQNPTAENIAIWIWNQLMFDALLKGISKITVNESDSSMAQITIQDRLSFLPKLDTVKS